MKKLHDLFVAAVEQGKVTSYGPTLCCELEAEVVMINRATGELRDFCAHCALQAVATGVWAPLGWR